MSSNISAVTDFDGEWFSWTPSAGDLVIEFADTQDVRSLWFPIMPIGIQFSATPTPLNGNPFYEANSTGNQSGPELVPLPEGTQTVTLAGATTTPIYLFASSYAYNPFKGLSEVNVVKSGQVNVTIGVDGTGTASVTFDAAFQSVVEIVTSPKWGANPPANAEVGTKSETLMGFIATVGGAAPSSTVTVAWIAAGT